MPEVYVARKRLLVGDHYVMPGEEVPEAASWRNLHSYLASGAVRLVQTDLEQFYGLKQEIPTDQPFDWTERPHNRRSRGALHPWAQYGQTGELPDGGGTPTPDPPVLSLTFPSDVPVMNAVMTSFDTELTNTGGEVLDCLGQWTLTLPADCTMTAAEVTVNMVDFDGPGADVLITFQDYTPDHQIIGSYGPFPCAAGMSGATTDQIVVDSDWSGDISVESMVWDGPDKLTTTTWNLRVNGSQ